MENQMEANIAHEMETGLFYRGSEWHSVEFIH